jgi:hypothetical protein
MAKVLILSVVIVGLFWYPDWQQAQARQQILRATVQITMIVPQLAKSDSQPFEPLPIPPDEYRPIARPDEYVVAEGLGTVVAVKGRSLLITHDHWSQLTADLGEVQFRDATGVLLAKMDLFRFKRLILSRNGGLMVLVAPGALEDLAVENGRVITKGQLLLAHRQDGQVAVSPVHMATVGVKDGVVVWRLQGQVVVNGDSGGGVWGDGRLLAVMWTAVMLEDGVGQERQETEGSVAAVWMDVQ